MKVGSTPFRCQEAHPGRVPPSLRKARGCLLRKAGATGEIADIRPPVPVAPVPDPRRRPPPQPERSRDRRRPLRDERRERQETGDTVDETAAGNASVREWIVDSLRRS